MVDCVAPVFGMLSTRLPCISAANVLGNEIKVLSLVLAKLLSPEAGESINRRSASPIGI